MLERVLWLAFLIYKPEPRWHLSDTYRIYHKWCYFVLLCNFSRYFLGSCKNWCVILVIPMCKFASAGITINCTSKIAHVQLVFQFVQVKKFDRVKKLGNIALTASQKVRQICRRCWATSLSRPYLLLSSYRHDCESRYRSTPRPAEHSRRGRCTRNAPSADDAAAMVRRYA